MRPALALVCLALLAGCRTQAPAGGESAAEPRGEVREARCPPDLANCESATGTVLYVEAVDGDGDGDAHFVLSSGESVTGPGISAIDVPRDLRPDPLPRAGDLVSAAGPVYRGSYGQRQIQAEVVRVADRD